MAAPAAGLQRKVRIIVGLALGTFVVGSILFFRTGFQGDKIEASKALVDTMGLKLEQFAKVCGRYPTSSEGLNALKVKPAPTQSAAECVDWRGPYSTEEFIDAWGNALFYSSDQKSFNLRSFGRDAKIGGDGSDADLVYTASELPAAPTNRPEQGFKQDLNAGP